MSELLLNYEAPTCLFAPLSDVIRVHTDIIGYMSTFKDFEKKLKKGILPPRKFTQDNKFNLFDKCKLLQ